MHLIVAPYIVPQHPRAPYMPTHNFGSFYLSRQHRVCSKCSCTVVEDEVHFLFECPAYDRIREKYNTVLFAQFGGCQEASSTMKHNSDNVRLFMDQEPSFQVAKFVYECMEFRRSEECEDYNPYFDLSLFGDEWQGRIFDTFSSGPRGDIAETFTSDGPGSSISAHGRSLGWLRTGAPFEGP